MKEYDFNKIKTPIHLSIGQEALAVGVCSQLEQSDKIVSTHRSHAHYLAKGGNRQALVDELYGKKSGCSGGRGGSMHLIDNENGILGSTSIVGGSIPIATGSALAQKTLNTDNVTVCFFGDGAAEEGVFHESLNFAGLKKLPVIYVCENNNYAVFTPESQRKNTKNVYEWGEKFGIEGVLINGNNLPEVLESAAHAVNKARQGQGATLIEARTFLKYSHVGNKTDFHLGHKNVGMYDDFMENSPINLLKSRLKNDFGFSDKENTQLIDEINNEIDSLFVAALDKDDVDSQSLFTNLYSDGRAANALD